MAHGIADRGYDRCLIGQALLILPIAVPTFVVRRSRLRFIAGHGLAARLQMEGVEGREAGRLPGFASVPGGRGIGPGVIVPLRRPLIGSLQQIAETAA